MSLHDAARSGVTFGWQIVTVGEAGMSTGSAVAAQCVAASPVRLPDALHRRDADAGDLGHGGRRPVRRLARWLGRGEGHDLVDRLLPERGTRDGRVLSHTSPSTPASAQRSCQRQTQVFDVPVRRMISTVPRPSADRSTIFAR